MWLLRSNEGNAPTYRRGTPRGWRSTFAFEPHAGLVAACSLVPIQLIAGPGPLEPGGTTLSRLPTTEVRYLQHSSRNRRARGFFPRARLSVWLSQQHMLFLAGVRVKLLSPSIRLAKPVRRQPKQKHVKALCTSPRAAHRQPALYTAEGC